MNYKELEQEVKRLEQQIKDLKVKLEEKAEKKAYEVEVPEDIGDYYYVDELGRIYLVRGLLDFDEHEYELLYKRGLAFKTKEEAEKYDKERILLFKLHKWAEEHNGDWTPNWKDLDEEKCTVMYDNQDEKLEIYETYFYRNFTKLPVFKSDELAKQFIEEFGDEIKEVLC